VQVAGANDDAFPGLGAGQRAARLHRNHERIAGDEPILGREPCAIEAGLFGPREDRVDIVRAIVLTQDQQRTDDERAPGKVVRGAHTDLVTGHLDTRHVEHGELAYAQLPVRADPAHDGRVVLRLDRRFGIQERRSEGWGTGVVLNHDWDVGREDALTEAAEYSRTAFGPLRVGDLEGGMIGVRGEHEGALRRASREMRVDLSERVGSNRDARRLELPAYRLEHSELVVGRGRRRCDATDDLDDFVAREKARHRGRGYRPARVLRLYDTRRRDVFPLRPRGPALTMYVCGVTPYDTTHLGHARTFVVFDVLTRLLETRGTRVRYAQNVTDVDESILQRAARDSVDWRALGRREERTFRDDMRRLGWRRPDVMPHATRELGPMKTLVGRLLDRGAAYALDGSVYFATSRDPHYGELSRFSPTKMDRILAQQDDARLDDLRRRDPLDFALWRRVPNGPVWSSPYGTGRPGWHLECSAMSLRHLGDQIDIHGGGADLIYPHHENEIAQSEAATKRRPFVRFWVHVAPMRLGGKKMSKSDGNMVFVRDALRRVSPQALRLYLLDVHYRTAFDHDERRLARAAERADRLATRLGRGRLGPIVVDRWTKPVLAALEDDLHIERAIRALERARPADGRASASLRTLARRVLGVL